MGQELRKTKCPLRVLFQRDNGESSFPLREADDLPSQAVTASGPRCLFRSVKVAIISIRKGGPTEYIHVPLLPWRMNSNVF